MAGGTLTLRGQPYLPASLHAAERLGIAIVQLSVGDTIKPTLSARSARPLYCRNNFGRVWVVQLTCARCLRWGCRAGADI
ncbi:hypothetical protein WJ30_21655 [Burkholderia diffusa]|nr:hypothetical protein WJ30_21655 [Burkholderia diffusa]